mmetsp:Transcript_416/g.615  ORF Transcript_416/g.615 Transcript_416/m.615 type:complete len:763 (+) Transcript_416:132-2420(+)
MSTNTSNADPVATVVSGHTFTVDSRYVLKDAKILGKGSFGVVTTAYDSVRKIDLAIKRIRPYANDEWDARHTLREIRLLKLLGNHPNIISLFELSLFEPKTELYMMMELMDCDLHRVIQSKQPLSEKHHKCFVKQILEGIRAMHAIGVFHRDLKPGNILVSKDCQLRITDFGLARFMDDVTRQGENQQNPMTEYVVTRWYRCPELLLSPNRPYDEAIDLWSIGCILAELLRRKPLFPGKSHANQVQLIFEVMGFSSVKELGFPVSTEAASFLEKRCRGRKQPFTKLFSDATPAAVEMLESLLMLNPSDRPTAAEALQNVFFADAETLHDYSKNYLVPPASDFFDFEMEKNPVPVLKELIDREVLLSSASNYRKLGQSGAGHLAVPSISVPQQQQQPSNNFSMHSNAMQESQSHTSRTDASTVSSAVATGRGSVNPATISSHGSHQPVPNPKPAAAAERGPNPSQQMQLQQYGRRGAPQQQRQQPNGNNNPNNNGKNNLAGYRRLSSDSQAFAAAQAGSMEDLTEGPVSQLSTQVRNFGGLGAGIVPEAAQQPRHLPGDRAAANNPFRKQSAAAAASSSTASIATAAASAAATVQQPPPLIYAPALKASSNTATAASEIMDSSDNAAANNSSNLQLEEEEAAVLSSLLSQGGGNILTAVRNDGTSSSSGGTSNKAGKTPKTPSPKKMEQILQMDLNNKRRFLMQGLNKQQSQQQSQSARGGHASNTSGTAPVKKTPSDDDPAPMYGGRILVNGGSNVIHAHGR